MEMQLKEDVVEVVAGKSSFNFKDFSVRFIALALTLVAAVLLGVDKETTTVSVTIVSSLPPLDLPVTAKWTEMSAFVYFVIANAIACSYGATSLILMLVARGRSKLVALVVTILDLVMVGLLFSVVGATSSIGLIGYNGNSHVHWDKVCNVFDKFCHQVAVAIFVSFAGSIAYLLLIVLAALKLHKKF
ncbi:CASP-like protein 1E2 [Bidens hawaiensis]|uniref:CASP-like protein 1E2 n=1 Tax=Bidens hawaiensis TaxID=980011 RepID=UPI004049BA0E